MRVYFYVYIILFFTFRCASCVGCVCGWQSKEKKSNNCLQHVFVSASVWLMEPVFSVLVVPSWEKIKEKNFFLRHDDGKHIFQGKARTHLWISPLADFTTLYHRVPTSYRVHVGIVYSYNTILHGTIQFFNNVQRLQTVVPAVNDR